MPDLEADEDRLAYLEDLVVFNTMQMKEHPIRKAELEDQNTKSLAQIKFLQKKIETGDGTCGSGIPIPGCQCEGCRYEYGELRAKSLKEAIARRPLKEDDGYIYYVRGQKRGTIKKAGKCLQVAARIMDGDLDFDTILFKMFTDPGFAERAAKLVEIFKKLEEDDLDQVVGFFPSLPYKTKDADRKKEKHSGE